MNEYKNKSRLWLEREKEIIEDALDDLKIVSARDIIGKYDENWQPRNDEMDEETKDDMYIHESELKHIENKIQNVRVTTLSEEQKDDILCDVLKRLHKVINRKVVECRPNNYFLIDVDQERIPEQLKEIDFLNYVRTPSGHHFVVEHFNSTELKKIPNVEIKKDALFFIEVFDVK